MQQRIEQQDQKIKELNGRMDKLYVQLHEQERENNALIRENNELRLALKEAEHNVCVRPDDECFKGRLPKRTYCRLKNLRTAITMLSIKKATRKKQQTAKGKGTMRITEYLKSLIRANSYDSSKSFALVLSVLVGALIGLCVCFCLVWDVCSNGHLETDLEGLGIFLLCVGAYMAGGGVNKALSERKRSINKEHINEKVNSNGKD